MRVFVYMPVCVFFFCPTRFSRIKCAVWRVRLSALTISLPERRVDHISCMMTLAYTALPLLLSAFHHTWQKPRVGIIAQQTSPHIFFLPHTHSTVWLMWITSTKESLWWCHSCLTVCLFVGTNSNTEMAVSYTK